MKSSDFKILTLLIAISICSVCKSQTNDASGTIPNGGHTGDTIKDYDASRAKHVHEQITIIPVHNDKTGAKSGQASIASGTTESKDTSNMGNNISMNADTNTTAGATSSSDGAAMGGPVTDNNKMPLYAAIGIFALAAIIGMYLITMLLTNRKNSIAITIIHGLLAATGIILLIYYCGEHTPGPLASIIIFCMAALGGIVMFYRDVTGKQIPKWLAIGHGLIALIGFGLLIVFVCCAPAI